MPKTEFNEKIVTQAIDRIRRKLLDLTRRNNLLNFRETKNTIHIVDELPDEIFRMLVSEDKSLELLELPEPDEEEKRGQLTVFNESTNKKSDKIEIKTDYELPQKSKKTSRRHTDKYLQTPLIAKILERRCKNLSLNSRSSIEETGINILYIVFGFLEWYEDDNSEIINKAPLILVPIRIERTRLNKKTNHYSYLISYNGEDIETNLSLAEKLNLDFNLILPEIKNEITPEAYFEEVTQTIRGKKQWRVAREIVLGFFSFAKLRIYKDLNDDSWPSNSLLSGHNNVKQIIAGFTGDKEATDSILFGEDFDIDKHPGVEKIYLVQEADSSQHSALIDVILNNKNIVIEGPPGTGKSQTITNLIAAALYNGDNVLFIAEKKAALEVVRRRLNNAGLGDFCLELHSHKTQKGQLLADIEKRLRQNYKEARTIDSKIAILNEQRDTLIKYYDLLNKKPGKTDETIFEILWAVERLREGFDKTPVIFNIDNCLELTSTQIETNVNAVDDFAKAFSATPQDVISVWKGFEPEALIPGDDTIIINKLILLIDKLVKLSEYYTYIKDHYHFPANDNLDTLRNYSKFSSNELPAKPIFYDVTLANNLLSPIASEVLVDLEDYIREYYEFKEEANEILNDFTDWNLEELLKIEKTISNLKDFSYSDLTPVHLKELLNEINYINKALCELQKAHEPIKDLLNKQPTKLADYLEIISIYKVIKEAPSEIEFNIEPKHAFPAAKVILEKAKVKHDELSAIQDNLSEIYNLKNTPDSADIRLIFQAFSNCDNFLKRLFSKEFKKAKHKLLTFLNNPKDLKRKNVVENLLILSEFKEDVHNFEEDIFFKGALGSYFNGIGTNWELVESVIQWAQKLSEKLHSPEMASSLLSDFLNNRERFFLTANNIFNLWTQIKDGLSKIKIEFNGDTDVRKLLIELSKRIDVLKKSHEILGLNKSISKFDLDSIYNAVDSAIVTYRLLESFNNDKRFPNIFSEHFVGIQTDIIKIREFYNWIEETRELLSFDNRLIGWIISENIDDRIEILKTFTNFCHQFVDELDQFIDNLSQYGEFDFHLWANENKNLDFNIDSFKSKLHDAYHNARNIIAWSDYCVARRKVKKIGLNPILEGIENYVIDPEFAKSYAKYIIYSSIARKIVRKYKILTNFQGTAYDNTRQRIAELDKTIQTLSRKQIAYKISKRNIPEGIGYGPVKNYTERFLIQRELTKKKRHIPIRQLVRRAGKALQSIKPCFMMSPLSVSQYLVPGHISFDLIVMDEASQLRLEEAISAVARGEKLVVVGDPKQLPPTTFFDRLNDISEEEEDEMMAAEEAESILDICQNNFHTRRLKWHYRSEHESLISFSNSEFYDNDLIIFPAPYTVNKNLGVHYHYIEGATYKKGRNRIEAEAVALAVADHFKFFPELSLGVATFNVEQRNLISDEIERLQKKDSWLESKITETENHEEPFFVKNLENVQGDERDIIFISTTYGPDVNTGQVYQRFGPINRPTGWRRLNVIVTRAKKRLHLFSSLHSSDVRVIPGASKGVVALHNYIKFCETGNIPELGTPSNREADSDFEVSVAKLLNQYGYKTTLQVGVAGFFIDIAVHNSDRPEEYLLGIECDGATYHSAKSIRDRDLLRQKILENKGWKIYRIWSTDWFKNREREIEKLLKHLDKLAKSSRLKINDKLDINTFENVTVLQNENITKKENLRNVLLEFRRKKIEPFIDNIENCILSDSLIEEFVQRMPTSKDEFLQFPIEIRSNISKGQAPKFLDDILEIIEEYAY